MNLIRRIDPRLAMLGALALTAAYVFFISRMSAFQDYPNHVTRGAIMADLMFHHGARYGALFTFRFMPVPYVLGDLVLAVAIALFGVAGGSAVFTALVLLSLPAALLFYMRMNAIAPSARPLILLLSLYLTTDWFFLMGFMGFRLALAMVIVSLALADAVRARWSTARFVWYVVALAGGYLIHLSALVFTGAVIFVSSAVRLFLRQTTVRRELWVLVPIVALAALHFGVIAKLGDPGKSVYEFSWGEPRDKLLNLPYEFQRFGGRQAVLLFLGLVFCVLWPVRRELRTAALARPIVVEQLALAVTFAGIYFVLPQSYSESSYVDIRALTLVVLFVMLAALHLADPQSLGRRFASVPVLLVAALVAGGNLIYIKHRMTANDRWIGQYRTVVEAIPEGASVLPVYTRRSQMTLNPYLHASSYVVLDRAAIMPYLFAGDRGDAMRYFRYRERPYFPPEKWYKIDSLWSSGTEATFEVLGRPYKWRFTWSADDRKWKMNDLSLVRWDRVSCIYDYLLITNPFDPALIEIPVETVRANAAATLLKVTHKTACAPGTEKTPEFETALR